MIKQAYEAGVKQAMIDAGLTKEAISPLAKYMGAGAAGGGILSGIAGGDLGSAFQGALSGGAAGAGVHYLPELLTSGKAYKKQFLGDLLSGAEGVSEAALKRNKLRELLGGIGGGAAGGAAGLGLGSLLSPEE